MERSVSLDIFKPILTDCLSYKAVHSTPGVDILRLVCSKRTHRLSRRQVFLIRVHDQSVTTKCEVEVSLDENDCSHKYNDPNRTVEISGCPFSINQQCFRVGVY